MKIRRGLILTICLVLVAVPCFAYTPWGVEEDDDLQVVVGELRQAYELALSSRAASPDFLVDLEALIIRLEALIGKPKEANFGWENLMSVPVEVTFFNRYVGSSDQIGEIFYFRINGKTEGKIWGTDIYTRDTDVAVAAVHAGLVRPGEGAVVAARSLPDQSSYQGTTRNGVTSSSYGAYGPSYEFVDLDTNTLLIADPGDLGRYENFVGQTLAFQVTGEDAGGIWGTDIYTIDSNLGTAVVHAGLLRPGETGIILVDFVPGQQSYVGSENFGVSSRDFWEYPFSYRLRRLR